MENGIADATLFVFCMACSALLLLLAALAWRSRGADHDTADMWAASLMIVGGAEIFLFYGITFSEAVTFEEAQLALRLTYIGWLTSLPLGVFYLSRRTGKDRWLRTPVAPIILVILPVIFGAVILSPLHLDLFFGGGFDPETMAFARNSPAYLVFYTWVWGMLLLLISITIWSAISSKRLNRAQITLVLACALSPLVLSSFSFFNFRIFGIGPAVLSLIPSCFTIYAIGRFPAFDLRAATAAEKALASEVGVVVLDAAGNVSAVNSSAVRHLGADGVPAKGRRIEDVWAHRPDVIAALRGAGVPGLIVKSASSGRPLTFDTSEISGASGQQSGQLVLVRQDGD